MLAIVPARAGSKGIPNKAMQPVGGKPLILRTLETVKESGIASEIVVSTDSPEIEEYCQLRGWDTMPRPIKLAGDKIPLLHVAQQVSHSLRWTGAVGLFQPTCPFITAQTICDVHRRWMESGSDWIIGVTEEGHIYWRDGQAIGRRLNRQYRRPLKRETGAVQLMTQSHLKTCGGGRKAIVTIPRGEALDIDTIDDLVLAEARARRGHVHFVVSVGKRIGSGHFHRCLTLAKALQGHAITWEWIGKPDGDQELAVSPLVNPRAAMSDELDGKRVTVFDCLSPQAEALQEMKNAGHRLLVLEDETRQSAEYADLIINELLDDEDRRYAVIRDEFLHLPPREHRADASRVMVTFGGTDPANLTPRVARMLNGIESRLILSDIVEPGKKTDMSTAMRAADVIVTSRGRTVLEAAVTETPCISLAVNSRERRHKKVTGVSYCASIDAVKDEVMRLLANKDTRESMAKQAREQVDGNGTARMVHAIEGLML